MCKNFQEKMYLEVNQYNLEYKNAIRRLLNTKDIKDVISPLTALITQYIENSIKSFLQDYIEIKETASKLKINNHNLKELIAMCKEKYALYTDMTEFLNPIGRLEEYLNYLEKIYGNEILVNSRYAIDSKTLRLNRKSIKIDNQEYRLKAKMMLWGMKELTIFYECEKLYSVAVEGENAYEKLNYLLEDMSNAGDFLVNTLYVGIIKRIDDRNKKLLKAG